MLNPPKLKYDRETDPQVTTEVEPLSQVTTEVFSPEPENEGYMTTAVNTQMANPLEQPTLRYTPEYIPHISKQREDETPVTEELSKLFIKSGLSALVTHTLDESLSSLRAAALEIDFLSDKIKQNLKDDQRFLDLVEYGKAGVHRKVSNILTKNREQINQWEPLIELYPFLRRMRGIVDILAGISVAVFFMSAIYTNEGYDSDEGDGIEDRGNTRDTKTLSDLKATVDQWLREDKDLWIHSGYVERMSEEERKQIDTFLKTLAKGLGMNNIPKIPPRNLPQSILEKTKTEIEKYLERCKHAKRLSETPPLIDVDTETLRENILANVDPIIISIKTLPMAIGAEIGKEFSRFAQECVTILTTPIKDFDIKGFRGGVTKVGELFKGFPSELKGNLTKFVKGRFDNLGKSSEEAMKQILLMPHENIIKVLGVQLKEITSLVKTLRNLKKQLNEGTIQENTLDWILESIEASIRDRLSKAVDVYRYKKMMEKPVYNFGISFVDSCIEKARDQVIDSGEQALHRTITEIFR